MTDMLTIIGDRQSGKTTALIALAMADPNGVLVVRDQHEKTRILDSRDKYTPLLLFVPTQAHRGRDLGREVVPSLQIKIRHVAELRDPNGRTDHRYYVDEGCNIPGWMVAAKCIAAHVETRLWWMGGDRQWR